MSTFLHRQGRLVVVFRATQFANHQRHLGDWETASPTMPIYSRLGRIYAWKHLQVCTYR
jgi:hypothetical protein